MNQYFLWISLPANPVWAAYDQMHAYMLSHNFVQTIAGSAGPYNLPPLMYAGHTDATADQLGTAMKAGIEAQFHIPVDIFVIGWSSWWNC